MPVPIRAEHIARRKRIENVQRCEATMARIDISLEVLAHQRVDRCALTQRRLAGALEQVVVNAEREIGQTLPPEHGISVAPGAVAPCAGRATGDLASVSRGQYQVLPVLVLVLPGNRVPRARLPVASAM